MNRASLTVITKTGCRYDANHISIQRTFNGTYNVSEISFLSSGSRITLLAELVEAIIFVDYSACWCSECEHRIDSL